MVFGCTGELVGEGLRGERSRDPGVTVPEPLGGAQFIQGDGAPVVGAALVELAGLVADGRRTQGIVLGHFH